KDDSLSILLSQLDVGSEIPEELFKAIVDIYVYFLDFRPNSNNE
ncbi:MAG: type secretion protein, partial [Bacillota bacterium]|nr:type secretion protein [Bacillota bacterium]